MTVHWHWTEISPSVWEVKRGKDRIGLCVRQPDDIWKASATHEGATGIATHRAPVNAIIVAINNMIKHRAQKRGTTRADELAKIDKRALDLMSSGEGRRRRRKRK